MKGYLHLADGHSYEGQWVHTTKETFVNGEVVFFTGMTGYQEVLTDPSYKNQIVVFTYPLIGNYGINQEDFESTHPQVAGVIVHEAFNQFYHYEARETLSQFLQKYNIPLLTNVDTRSIVKHIRDNGSMQASLTVDEEKGCNQLPVNQKVSEVSVTSIEKFGTGEKHIVLYDFGYKKSILHSLLKLNCSVSVVPYNTTVEEVKALRPNGILLSNGPGNPKDLVEILPTIKELMMVYPTFGICLGHQLAALAFGGDTKKLLFGHRGANHPVIDHYRKTVMMTSQNHSYEVDSHQLSKTGFEVRFSNIHEGSIEGLVHKRYPVMTVQFHPEANPGPNESEYILEEFMNNMIVGNRRVAAYA